jgi:glycosyltransferase involved in cell wall biosynthesis
MGAADVFVLTSREDPYPLVCLEAAALEKPIVCFAGAGGMPEFVENDCGFVVPYLDIAAMGDHVVSLLDAPDLRVVIGRAARRKVSERHDVGKAAPRILEIIERRALTLNYAKCTRSFSVWD